MSRTIRVDLHCHTVASHDGHTGWEDLALRCAELGIDAVAVTDHDLAGVDSSLLGTFVEVGVRVIPGCEVTCDRGAHVVAYWSTGPTGDRSPQGVADHVSSQGGVLMIPHPFKRDSGLLSVFQDQAHLTLPALQGARWMELWNGGWPSDGYRDRIREIASEFDLDLVACSDSHKIWQVGYYVTDFSAPAWEGNGGGVLVDRDEFVGATVVGHWRWSSGVPRMGERSSEVPTPIRSVQRLAPYGVLVRLLPAAFKRRVKHLVYQKKRQRWMSIQHSGAYERI